MQDSKLGVWKGHYLSIEGINERGTFSARNEGVGPQNGASP